eukprot:708407-Prorocentrum_minimum.AAC.2
MGDTKLVTRGKVEYILTRCQLSHSGYPSSSISHDAPERQTKGSRPEGGASRGAHLLCRHSSQGASTVMSEFMSVFVPGTELAARQLGVPPTRGLSQHTNLSDKATSSETRKG